MSAIRMPRFRSKAEKKETEYGETISPKCQLSEFLASELLSYRLCDTNDEAAPTAEAIVEECFADDECTFNTDDVINLKEVLLSYFDQLTDDDATTIGKNIMGISVDEDANDVDESSTSSSTGSQADQLESDDDENSNSCIGEGECELCERNIKLTRHHLIPKSTWPKMKKRIQNAVDALKSNEEGKARIIMGGTLLDELPQQIIDDPRNTKAIRIFLSQTVHICRICHSKVHSLHTEMELAEKFYNIDLLLQDAELLKFAKWASKQRCGKYSREF